MSVTFSGLASGLDSATIIEALMDVERVPLEKMEAEEEYLEAKLDTYSEFNTLLDNFYSIVDGIDDESDLSEYTVTNNGEEYFSVSTNSLAQEGTYKVEVVNLAQRQKDINDEYIADTDTTLLSGELQIGDQTLSYSDMDLDELVSTINEGDYGVTANITNDGTGNGYRMILTADSSGEELEIIGSGSITLNTTENGHTMDGKKAHIVVDGVDYYSTSNTFDTSIKGTEITLLAESGDAGSQNLFINSDTESSVKSKIQDMLDAYNEISSFIGTLKETDSNLSRSLEYMQRSLKSTLTGSAFIELGVKSDWETNTLSLDTTMLSDAWDENPENVLQLLLGDGETEGVVTSIASYLDNQTDSISGFYAVKEDSIETEISRLQESMESLEYRLEIKQANLEEQYAALETLISSMNSTADYLESFFSS